MKQPAVGDGQKKVLFAFGTRPEAIKMAPVIAELSRYPQQFKTCVVVTAQHRQLLDQVLTLFEIRPDYDLGVMRNNQGVSDVVKRCLAGLEPVLAKECPDLVLVQGDATSAFAAALAAYYQRIPVGHIEAGLRTFDKYAPFPEELNRRFISAVADYHFAPTEWARDNLLREGVVRQRVYVTGNTVIDALLSMRQQAAVVSVPVLDSLSPDCRVLLVTLHRRESFGRPLLGICRAIRTVVRRHPDVVVVYPVHPNPNVSQPVRAALGRHKRVLLIPPLNYLEFIRVLECAYFVLTDSGGVTEEAPALGKPVLILRDKTERPEAITAGVARLAGTAPDGIVHEAERLLTSPALYRRMARAKSPFGDGRAAVRIRRILAKVITRHP